MRYAQNNLCQSNPVTDQMIYKYRDWLNRYLTHSRYKPTEEEAEVAQIIYNDFVTDPDPFPLCENAIESKIAENVDDYYTGNSGIRDRIVSALILTKCQYRAVFAICRKGRKTIHWYATKDIAELQRTISANYVICNYSGADAERAGIEIGEEIANSDTLLAVVFKDFREETCGYEL